MTVVKHLYDLRNQPLFEEKFRADAAAGNLDAQVRHVLPTLLA